MTKADIPQGKKRPGRLVNHSFPSSTEVKNETSYTSASPSWRAPGQLNLWTTMNHTQRKVGQLIPWTILELGTTSQLQVRVTVNLPARRRPKADKNFPRAENTPFLA
jgi:hypothetical protein